MPAEKEMIFQGIPASPGIIIGIARSLNIDSEDVLPQPIADPENEIRTFKLAIDQVKKTLEETGKKINQRLGSEFVRIFEAQVMIASDKVWNDNIVIRIRKEKLCAEYIYHDEAQKVIRRLGESKDAYLRERMQDIESVTHRLIGRLKGEKRATLKGLRGSTVVLARYLYPGDLLPLTIRRNLGFATGIGGPTSHLALIAKSLSIPAVIGVGEVAERVKSGARVIIDGYKGVFVVNPSPETVRRFKKLKESENQLKRQLTQLKSKSAVTLDKKNIEIMANIELPNEIPKVLAAGASGIGLYRTEYMFLTRLEFPTFEEQYKTYSSVLRRMGGKPVVIRTFDMGGDKFPGAAGKGFELNPFLGWRAIRVCLDRPEVFKPQLKALLRASRWGNLSIMIPMISNYEELAAVRKIFEECKQELREQKKIFKENVPLGVMIEVPSAALIADSLAGDSDFFSVGTNDLIQYTLAVDRGNEFLSKLYQSYHPAHLMLIKKSVEAAHSRNIKLSVCGEMAADPIGAILLIGLGVDTLSVSFQSVGILKKIVRSVSYRESRRMAEHALQMRTNSEIERYMKNEIENRFPDLNSVMRFVMRG